MAIAYKSQGASAGAVAPTWENIDSDNTTGTDTDFVLTGSVPVLTNYKDAQNIISCRVYQLSI